MPKQKNSLNLKRDTLAASGHNAGETPTLATFKSQRITWKN